ncbi:DNA polymerase III subunit epsilon [Lysobacter soyae]|uniref:DNA polymerase III subunit epsilon n=1 Tax=Lysobacter soyae TaxID=2764185 RepID=A0ABX8WSA2_9GAMM|nr:DNA polymerase III subunit epsilon [Lysobacter sp. CJ11]QYR53727.1 DNA polymerase III subunit epsilon [Lysobacter sp. CJ11]
MRQVVLDTETTGLSPQNGDRVVEIGCVELMMRRPTGRSFQVYLNPQRAMSLEAVEITGLSDAFLQDKPLFAEVADAFLEFVEGAELVIHNAEFDMGFLENELRLLRDGREGLASRVTVLDTVKLARSMYPGQRVSLDSLCRRLGVDNSGRDLHGALLDAQLLAEVYLAMTSGQHEMGFAVHAEPGRAKVSARSAIGLPPRPRMLVSPTDEAAHRERTAAIAKKSGVDLWSD